MYPTPRATTRSDSLPPASQPSGGVTITRPSIEPRREPARPPAIDDMAPRARPGAVDGRYRPSPEAARSEAKDPGLLRRTPPTPAPRATPVVPTPDRPRSIQPPATNRYVPREPAPAARPAPRPDPVRDATPRLARPGTPVATVRPAAPTLSLRRPATPAASASRSFSGSLVARASGHYRPRYYSGSHWQHCDRAIWYGYWDPFHCHTSWRHSHGWSIGIGCSVFSWRINLWHPFWYCRRAYWDWCYYDAFWCSWSRPYCVTTSYWWYPTTTYCPTYLYVPSTVVVYETAAAPATTATAPSATPAVVARSSVVDEARGSPTAGVDEMSANLARKYVELGDFYFRADRFRDAAEAYGKARSYVPDDAGVHFVLADAVFADGDYPYAAFLVAEGLRLDPALATADADKRAFYGDAKTFDSQLLALERHLARHPDDAQAHFVHGYNLAFSRRPDAALRAFRRTLEIDPGHRAAATFAGALESASAPASVAR